MGVVAPEKKRATTCFGGQYISVRLNAYKAPIQWRPQNILVNVSHSGPIDYIVIMEIVWKVQEVAYIIKITFTKIEKP